MTTPKLSTPQQRVMNEVATTGKTSSVNMWSGVASSAWHRTVESLVRKGLLAKRGSYTAMLPMDADHLTAIDEDRERHHARNVKNRADARWHRKKRELYARGEL